MDGYVDRAHMEMWQSQVLSIFRTHNPNHDLDMYLEANIISEIIPIIVDAFNDGWDTGSHAIDDY